MRSRESFELHLARIGETEIAGALSEIVQGRGDQDLAAMRERRDPRCENYRLAEEIRGFIYWLADVQTDPCAICPILRDIQP